MPSRRASHSSLRRREVLAISWRSRTSAPSASTSRANRSSRSGSRLCRGQSCHKLALNTVRRPGSQAAVPSAGRAFTDTLPAGSVTERTRRATLRRGSKRAGGRGNLLRASPGPEQERPDAAPCASNRISRHPGEHLLSSNSHIPWEISAEFQRPRQVFNGSHVLCLEEIGSSRATGTGGRSSTDDILYV